MIMCVLFSSTLRLGRPSTAANTCGMAAGTRKETLRSKITILINVFTKEIKPVKLVHQKSTHNMSQQAHKCKQIIIYSSN